MKTNSFNWTQDTPVNGSPQWACRVTDSTGAEIYKAGGMDFGSEHPDTSSLRPGFEREISQELSGEFQP